MMRTDKKRQTKVFGTNMLSFKRKYVSTAKITLETPKPISFEVHKRPVSSTIYLMAYQKHKPIGMAKMKFDNIGLSFHQSQTNCELN
tara:strand:+ start:504 stop:764 length:261 start_codon:yes stop_codon:yes gene_type:complete